MGEKKDYRYLWILGAAMIIGTWVLPLAEHSDSFLKQAFWTIVLILIIGGAFYWMSKLK